MFGKKENNILVDHWLAYCVSLTTRRHGVYLNREEIEKHFPEKASPKSIKELNDFLAKKKLQAKAINISIDDLKSKDFVLPCAVPLKNGGSIIVLNVQKKDDYYFIKILDPLDSEGKQQDIEISEFEKLWKNTVIALNVIRGTESKDRSFDVKWFLPELWNCRYVLICAFIFSILLNILAFTPIIFIQISLDKVVGYKAESTLYVLSVGVIVALMFNSMMGYIREYIFNFIGDKIESRISGDVFDKLLGLPLLSVQGENIGKFGRSMQAITSLRNSLVKKVFHGMFDLTAVMVYVPVLFAYNMLMGMIVLGFAVLMGVNKIIFNNIGKKISEDLSGLEGQKNSLIRETLSGMYMLKELGEEETQKKHWRELAAASIRVRSKKDKVNSTSTEFNGFLQQVMTVAIIFTGVQLVFMEELSAGSIIAINMVAGRLVAPVIAGITLMSEKNQILGMIAQVGDIWNKDKERMGAGVHTTIRGKYSMSNISMNFGDVRALKNISFEIQPKSKIGIIGPSGAGKTTLLNLIAGVYPPTDGKMDIDGIRITQFDLSHYRSQVMLLSKNPVFFKGTIEDNLFRVSPNIGHRELDEIFSLTGFDDHLLKLPDGIHTIIDENASQLAGAGSSLLALTRALLANPKVLLLDEFADPLDINIRIKLQENFSSIFSDRTLFDAQNVISHELDSISNYDKIIVLNEGEIVGQGTHEELVSTCQIYQEMLEKEKKLNAIS
jgi:ATP-binding cassette subfamily B protein